MNMLLLVAQFIGPVQLQNLQEAFMNPRVADAASYRVAEQEKLKTIRQSQSRYTEL